jgi:hypothetical protein
MTNLPFFIALNTNSQTLSECIKTINSFGATTYQNICTGQANVVLWGGADWALAILAGIFGLSIIAMILAVAHEILVG